MFSRRQVQMPAWALPALLWGEAGELPPDLPTDNEVADAIMAVPTHRTTFYSLVGDGSSGYVQVTSFASFQGTTFSVGSWVRATDDTHHAILFDNQVDAGQGSLLYIDKTSKHATCYLYPTGVTAAGSANLYDDTWHLLVATFTGTTLKLYVDNALVDTQTCAYTGAGTGTSGFMMAQAILASYGVHKQSEVFYTQSVLTLTNVQNIFNKSLDPATLATLQLDLKFTDGSGTTVTDYGPNNYNGTVHGSATWNADNPFVTESFTITPTSIPKNHSGNITLTLAGTGTSFNNSTSVFTPSGVAGVTKISQNVTSTTAATVVVTTDATHTGTLTITESVTGTATATTTVATAALAISPTSGSIGATPTITLTGTNTVWLQETASSLFQPSGSTGNSISGTTPSDNTHATCVLTVGTGPGPIVITDTSTGQTASFTVNRAPATYYIRSDGNNSNTGTANNSGGAWLTIGKVNGFTQVPGDVYDFQTATFNDATLTPPTSGVQGLPITYTSSSTTKATIATGATDRFGISIVDLSFITVTNLKVTGPGFTGSAPSFSTTSTHAGVHVFSQGYDATAQLNSINLDNLDVSGFWNGIMVVTRSAISRSFIDPNAAPYYQGNGTIATANVVGFNNVSVTNCTVHEFMFAGILFAGGYPNNGNNIGWDDPVDTFQNVYIADNNVYHAYSATPGPITIVNCTGGMIERNVVANAGAYASSPIGIACIVVGRSRDITVQWNELYGTVCTTADGTGIDLDADAQGCVVQFNFCHDNAGSGIICLHNGTCGQNQNNTIRFNNLYNNVLQTTNVTGSLEDQGISNIWHNNDVYINAGATSASTVSAVNITAASTGGVWVKNIFITTGNIPMVDGTIGTAIFRDNTYFPSGGTLHIGSRTSLAAWQTTDGQEQTADGLLFGSTADPLLVGESGFGAGAHAALLPAAQVGTLTDFDLTGSSPCIGTGVDVLAILGRAAGPVDFHGYPNRVVANRPPDRGSCTYNGKSLVPNISGGGFFDASSMSGGLI